LNYKDALKAVADGKPVFSATMAGAIVPLPGMAPVFMPSHAGVLAGAPQEIKAHVAMPAFEAADDWVVPGAGCGAA